MHDCPVPLVHARRKFSEIEEYIAKILGSRFWVINRSPVTLMHVSSASHRNRLKFPVYFSDGTSLNATLLQQIYIYIPNLTDSHPLSGPRPLCRVHVGDSSKLTILIRIHKLTRFRMSKFLNLLWGPRFEGQTGCHYMSPLNPTLTPTSCSHSF